MSKERAIAFDFGLNHIGVAVGNLTLGTVQSLKAIKAKDGKPNDADLDALFKEWQPGFIVVGYPLNMDGTTEAMGQRARKFGKRLMSKYQLRVFFKDERLTSAAAKEEIFNYQGGYRALKDKGRIDSTAAKLILQGFFDCGGCEGDFDFHDPSGEHRYKEYPDQSDND